MKLAMIKKFGRVTASIKPSVLRYFYKDLTGECNGYLCAFTRTCIQCMYPQGLFIDMLCTCIIGDQSASSNCDQSQIDNKNYAAN